MLSKNVLKTQKVLWKEAKTSKILVSGNLKWKGKSKILNTTNNSKGQKLCFIHY